MKKLNIITLQQLVMTTLFLFGFGLSSIAQDVVEELEVGKTEVIKISNTTVIKNLIINADKNNSGQLNIESGVVTVEKLTYRLTLEKDDWTMVAFPSAIQHVLEPEFTNFAALGFKHNIGLDKVFQFKKFNPVEAMDDRNAWRIVTDKRIEGGEAYQLSISGNAVTTPVAVDFYFSNISFGVNEAANNAIVDLDLKGKTNKESYFVTISTINADAEPLTVEVYNDLAFAPIPVNHQVAIDESRFIFTEENDAFRIVLPNDEPCRLLIMDKKMKKVIEAIEYVSPATIPTADLKRGKYKVVMQYGPATGIKDLKID